MAESLCSSPETITTLLISFKVKVAQSFPTLCDPMDYTVHAILQARILEWVAFPFSRDLLNPGIEPRSPTLLADFLPAEPQKQVKIMKYHYSLFRKTKF